MIYLLKDYLRFDKYVFVAFYDICNNNIILQNNVLYIIRHRRCIDFQYMYRYDKWMVCRFSSVLYANVIDTYSI